MSLRRADFFDPEPEPDLEAPPHARHCSTHALFYRAPVCPKCADVVRGDAARAETARVRALMTPSGRAAQKAAKDALTPEKRAEIGRRSVAGRKRGGAGARQRAKTHCPLGHAYTAGNTRVNARGHRSCKACNREKARSAYRAQRQAEQLAQREAADAAWKRQMVAAFGART